MPPIKVQRGTRKAGSIIFSGMKASAGTIGKCKAVYITDVDSDGIALIEPSLADDSGTMPSWGITSESVDNSDDVVVVLSGFMYNVDTSGWSAKTDLYVSASVAGELTSTVPDGSQYAIEPVAGVIKSHATEGILDVYNVGISIHAKRGGGTLHAVATGSIAGFMSAVDKTKLDGISGSDNYFHKSTISSWTESGELYYADVVHNLGTNDTVVQAYTTADNKTVGLEDIERTDTDTIRIWVGAEENVRVLVMRTPPLDFYSGTVSAWTPSGGIYYGDLTHNLSSNDVVVHTYLPADGKSVEMEDIERTDTNTIRLWSATNTENVRATILKI